MSNKREAYLRSLREDAAQYNAELKAKLNERQEAAEQWNIAHASCGREAYNDAIIRAFKAGAVWQQKKMFEDKKLDELSSELCRVCGQPDPTTCSCVAPKERPSNLPDNYEDPKERRADEGEGWST